MRGKKVRSDCSSIFCHGGESCIYCTVAKSKRSHCYFKKESGPGHTYRVSLSEGFREWRRSNEPTYQSLWKEIKANKEENQETVYTQIARYKKICDEAHLEKSYTRISFCVSLFAVVYCLFMFI